MIQKFTLGQRVVVLVAKPATGTVVAVKSNRVRVFMDDVRQIHSVLNEFVAPSATEVPLNCRLAVKVQLGAQLSDLMDEECVTSIENPGRF